MEAEAESGELPSGKGGAAACSWVLSTQLISAFTECLGSQAPDKRQRVGLSKV